MTRRLHPICILALLLGTARPALALNRTELMPSDIQLSIRVSNTLSFWEKLKQSSLGRLWADQQFQDFLGHPGEEVWNEIFFDGEKTAEDEIILEQLKMARGEVIFAMGKNEGDDPYAILAISPEDFQRSLVLDEKIADVGEESFDIVRSTFQDVEIIEHISDPGTPQESRNWQAHLNKTLVMGPSREWVEKSIVRLKAEAVVEPEGNPVMDLRVPLAALISNAVKEADAEQAATPAAVNSTTLFEALGLMGIEEFSARLELKDGELTVDNTLVASSLGKGIFTLLNVEPAEIPAVGFVPDNISLLEVGRIDLLRFWQEIPAVLMAAMPEAKPQYDMIMGMIRQQTGIDIELDLLSHLGTRYVGFTSFENEAMVNVMALELRDGAAFRRGLEAILNCPMVQPQLAQVIDTVDFLDHTLYVSKTTEPSDTFAFAVAGSYLLYGQPDGVRQVIRSESSPAAANPRFEQSELVQGLRRNTPPNAFAYSAIDWKKNLAYLIRELSKPQFSRVFLGQWATSGSPIPPPDLNKLPSADHLASFFGTSYQYVEKTDRGLHQKIVLKY